MHKRKHKGFICFHWLFLSGQAFPLPSLLALVCSLSASVITDFSLQRLPNLFPHTHLTFMWRRESFLTQRSELSPSSLLIQISLERPFDTRPHFKEGHLVYQLASGPSLITTTGLSFFPLNMKTRKTGPRLLCHLLDFSLTFQGCRGDSRADCCDLRLWVWKHQLWFRAMLPSRYMKCRPQMQAICII